MLRNFHRIGRRRMLLLTASIAGAFWSGMAQAQVSKADIAQAEAEVDVARAELALANANLNLIRVRGEGHAPEAADSSAAKLAEATSEPKTAPELNQIRNGAVTTDKNDAGGYKQADKGEKSEDDKTKEKAKEKARAEFGGLEFGVGISFTLDVGANDRITEAELVNGLVRVKDEDNGRARIMLESHYFFKPAWAPFDVTPGDFGWGPFIALQPGTDNIIEAVAIGGMVGFRRPGEGTESFNLGLGLVIDPNTRILGDGIVANQPLPVGETTIRYKEKMQTGVLLLTSFGF